MDNNTLWYQNAVFYEVYVRGFFDGNGDGHGDLAGLTTKLDYIQSLGVDCIWLLPTYPSPLRDDGYDIADYYGVHPQFGNLEDFKTLVSEVHRRGMRIITDLVMNHTSDQHPWFQAARSSRQSPYRDYYVWSDSDQKYRDTRIIFLDTEPSNWTWDEQAGQYFWHRFYATQPDLNFDNPAVRAEMLKIARYWLDLGVDGFRADAVPYLIEREGTNCENLPETHDYLKEVRRFVEENYPGRILLCEANQWPRDVRPYFGDGDEFHLGFHFPAMPRIYKSIAAGDGISLVQILNDTPAIPENCQWCTFLRNHDELTLEMVSEEDRQWMWQTYAPDLRMRLNQGIRRRLWPLLDGDPRKVELAYSLLFTLPGSPVLYYGDEIGMGDNIELFDRNGVRTPMQWDARTNAGFSPADPQRLYAPVIDSERFGYQRVNVAAQQADPQSPLGRLRRMVALRKQTPAFGPGPLTWMVTGETLPVLAYLRSAGGQTVLVVNNLTDREQTFEIPAAAGAARWLNLFAADEIHTAAVCLPPFGFLWLERLA